MSLYVIQKTKINLNMLTSPIQHRLVLCIALILGASLLSGQENTCPPFSQGINEECKTDILPPKVNIYQYRTIDGRYNNLRHPNWGATQVPMRRKGKVAHYNNNDGHSIVDRGNPRMISNLLANQDGAIDSEGGLSALVFTFLQFIDHDITITEEDKAISVNIPVPTGDSFFDPNGTGQAIIPFHRTKAILGTGTLNKPRQNVNFISAWIDGSGVYGSDHERAAWLRSGEYGRLKSHQSPYGELLPCNTITGDCNESVDMQAPFMAGNRDRCGQPVKVFVAGDIRANEQVGLTIMHTLFSREHNRICELLKAKGHTNDEWNYQYARKLVGGMIQAITYEEVLPALGINFGTYRYKRNKRPDIFNEFATAAYRLGHTMVTDKLYLIDDNCDAGSVNIGCNEETIGVFGGASCLSQCGFENYENSLSLKNAFFNPSILANNGIDQVLRGLTTQTQQQIDTKIVGSIRNFLFGQPGQGGLDLAALNIQRGRDHGLPDYNTMRALYGLECISDFDEITTDEDTQDALAAAYGNVDNIDPWVGLLAEDHMSGKEVGPTLFRILRKQFNVIRSGDRFYFENDRMIRSYDKEMIRSTRLADIISRNTDIKSSNAFAASDCEMLPTYCDVSGMDSQEEWIKEVFISDDYNYSGNDGGYGNFSDQVIDLKQGNYEPVYLKAGYLKYRYVENWRIWIDFNKDGDYDDAGEQVFRGRRRKKAKGYLHIPASAQLGLTGMRISMSYYRQSDACESIQYGEIEDYTVNILPSSGNHRVDSENRPTQDVVALDDNTSLKVYPNPTTGPTTIQFYSNQDQKASLRIVHISGKEMYSSDLGIRAGENYIEIDCSLYPVGLYTAFIDFEKTGRKNTKLVVVRD